MPTRRRTRGRPLRAGQGAAGGAGLRGQGRGPGVRRRGRARRRAAGRRGAQANVLPGPRPPGHRPAGDDGRRLPRRGGVAEAPGRGAAAVPAAGPRAHGGHERASRRAGGPAPVPSAPRRPACRPAAPGASATGRRSDQWGVHPPADHDRVPPGGAPLRAPARGGADGHPRDAAPRRRAARRRDPPRRRLRLVRARGARHVRPDAEGPDGGRGGPGAGPGLARPRTGRPGLRQRISRRPRGRTTSASTIPASRIPSSPRRSGASDPPDTGGLAESVGGMLGLQPADRGNAQVVLVTVPVAGHGVGIEGVRHRDLSPVDVRSKLADPGGDLERPHLASCRSCPPSRRPCPGRSRRRDA